MPAAHPGYHCLHLYATHTFHRFLKSASKKPTETIMVNHKRSEEAKLPHIKLEDIATAIADILRNHLPRYATSFKADSQKPTDDSDPTDKVKADKSDKADLGEGSELIIKWGEAMATMCEVNHRGLYLLLMSFYHQIDHRRQLLKLSEYSSTSDVQALQPFLRGLPECKTLTSQALASYLNQDHPEPVFRLTKWMQSTFGQNFYPPPDFLKVFGFSDNIWQFAVVNPPTRIQDQFDAAVMFHGQTSVRWHGTAINTLHPILQNGFLTDKIWTAGMPGVSWRYAFKKGAREALEAVRHPLFDHGVLLGLEVAGPPNKNIVTRLQVEADRYMVRYIFLLPPNTPKPNARSSRHINLSMEAAFREWPSPVED